MMARTIKIDNALQKRFAYKSNRNKNKQNLRVYFLIVCEGEKTEPNYFRKFPKQVGKYIFDIEYDGGEMNTLGVVETAIELRDKSPRKYDRVWAVFDRDSFPAGNFNAAIAKAKANGINCAWSNEAFELWYLLHFQYRNTPMSRDDYKMAIESEIKTHLENFRYAKNSTEMYALLQKYGNQDQAIANAEKLSNSYDNQKFAAHNPRTQIYELVNQLIGKDEILNKEIKEKFKEGQ
jgi:hypothetical protein